MSPEAQRIAIAKACGEINPRFTESGACIASTATADGIEWGTHGVANYLNDLNAMRDAEQQLWEMDWSFRTIFNDHLANIIKRRKVNRNEWDAETLLDSTSAQRAEALLRTLNLWQESPPTTP